MVNFDPKAIRPISLGDIAVVRSADEEYQPPLKLRGVPLKETTNTEVVMDLMEYSPYGVMSQIMIVEAIRHYVEMVAACPMDENSKAATIINPIAWNGCAANIKERMEARYGNPRSGQTETGSGEQDNNNSEGT